MPTGTVKWFNNAKGYGFILPEGGGEDLFVHYSSIQMDGYKTLKAGQSVLYENQQGDKGSQAINVTATEESHGSPGRGSSDSIPMPMAAGPRSG
ncbi:MAG: cold shock domain-containing protein [Gammaproteobacteria bacterium]|nr:MAG: cold shock domain-containing protein [Gammaproteobacteria bacterium]